MRLYSWNVNGIRAAAKYGLLEWLAAVQPDILCLQETRAQPDQLPAALREPAGYTSHWAAAERPGYSGVATFARVPVAAWRAGFGINHFDREGRVVMTDLGDFDLYNVYFPNGKASPERLAYKVAFSEAFLEHVDSRARAGRPAIFCGDVNTAHHPIDLARPKANETISGFLPEERAYLDRWLAGGWIDSFRQVYPDRRDAYSWWTRRLKARQRNIGWRIDYFFVHESLASRITDAGICPEVAGSDHCPVWVEIAG